MADVIVVGGGPVGFITALGLARSGVSVELLEAEDHIIDSPRAAIYHWSVLDGLERLGIMEDARAAGLCKTDYCFLVRETGEAIRYDLGILEGHAAFPYNFHLGQQVLADIARQHLATHANARVRFGSRVERVEQDAGGVTAYIHGSDEPVRAKWLIAADGGGSGVRKSLGLAFEGMTWPERFVATNVFFDFETIGYGLTTMVVDEAVGAAVVKLDNDGLWRCTFMESTSLPEETYRERIPAVYRQLMPPGAKYELERASPYQMHQRSVEKYRVGRVLLAGDAAHVTNPTGGLGLTSGMFDAYALYERLAAVIRDGADERLLDDYAAARRKVFVDLVSPQATRNKQLVYHCNGGGAGLETALNGLRRMSSDPDYRLEQLMFYKKMETPPLAEGRVQ